MKTVSLFFLCVFWHLSRSPSHGCGKSKFHNRKYFNSTYCFSYRDHLLADSKSRASGTGTFPTHTQNLSFFSSRFWSFSRFFFYFSFLFFLSLFLRHDAFATHFSWLWNDNILRQWICRYLYFPSRRRATDILSDHLSILQIRIPSTANFKNIDGILTVANPMDQKSIVELQKFLQIRVPWIESWRKSDGFQQFRSPCVRKIKKTSGLISDRLLSMRNPTKKHENSCSSAFFEAASEQQIAGIFTLWIKLKNRNTGIIMILNTFSCSGESKCQSSTTRIRSFSIDVSQQKIILPRAQRIRQKSRTKNQ